MSYSNEAETKTVATLLFYAGRTASNEYPENKHVVEIPDVSSRKIYNFEFTP